jgi:hypothetical protein
MSNPDLCINCTYSRSGASGDYKCAANVQEKIVVNLVTGATFREVPILPSCATRRNQDLRGAAKCPDFKDYRAVPK